MPSALHQVYLHTCQYKKHWRLLKMTSTYGNLQIKSLEVDHQTEIVKHGIRPYSIFTDELVMTDGLALKGWRAITSSKLQTQTLEQLHHNQMGINKKATFKRIHVLINTDIENTMKNCSTWLWFQQMQSKEKIILHETPDKPWDETGADPF